MFPGATIFPEGLALGSTFDLPLVKSIYAAAAQESRGVGLPKAFRLGYHVRVQKSRIKPHPVEGTRVRFKLERDAKNWEAVFHAARTLSFYNP